MGGCLEETCSDTTFYRAKKIVGALSRVPANRVHLLQVRSPSLPSLLPSLPHSVLPPLHRTLPFSVAILTSFLSHPPLPPSLPPSRSFCPVASGLGATALDELSSLHHALFELLPLTPPSLPPYLP